MALLGAGHARCKTDSIENPKSIFFASGLFVRQFDYLLLCLKQLYDSKQIDHDLTPVVCLLRPVFPILA